MQILIRDHQRGVLLRDGRPVEWLEPGRHRFEARVPFTDWRSEAVVVEVR